MAAIKQVPLVCGGHERPVVALKFSGITEDGSYLISASKDGKPMLRKGETGDWIGTFEGHKGAVWGATLNKDATLAATGAADFSAKLWDAVRGTEIKTFSHKHIVKAVDFSQDSTHLLTACNDKKLRIFSVEKKESDPVVMEGLTGNSKACLWYNRDTVLNGGEDKALSKWDVRTSTVVKKVDFESTVTSMELSADLDVLVVTYGKTVAFYNPESLEPIKSFDRTSPMYAASLHQSKKFYVAGGEDFCLYKIDYSTGEVIESFKGHFGPVHCVQFSPDGELYASGSEDGTLRLWQTVIGKTYGLWRSYEDDEKPSVVNGVDAVSEES